jgi:signal transduction histidine kinase
VRNLTDNAIRYGKVARVHWRKSDSVAEICVEDAGPGIPDKDLRAVFGPYVRLETSRSRDTGGHGLGLSIARSIILEHGGSIMLSNMVEGGLRAVVRLPLQGQASLSE